MSKPQQYEDRLRGDFKRYLVKIACNKSDSLLTEGDVLKAFDLAVQKQKLTSLENELVLPKRELQKSKIDIPDEIFMLEAVLFINHCAELETADVTETDEPYAAKAARDLIAKFKIVET